MGHLDRTAVGAALPVAPRVGVVGLVAQYGENDFDKNFSDVLGEICPWDNCEVSVSEREL